MMLRMRSWAYLVVSVHGRAGPGIGLRCVITASVRRQGGEPREASANRRPYA